MSLWDHSTTSQRHHPPLLTHGMHPTLTSTLKPNLSFKVPKLHPRMTARSRYPTTPLWHVAKVGWLLLPSPNQRHSPTLNQRQNPSPNPNQKCMRSLHHEMCARQARAPSVTRALPVALHPCALVVISLCSQAWPSVVVSARLVPTTRTMCSPDLLWQMLLRLGSQYTPDGLA